METPNKRQINCGCSREGEGPVIPCEMHQELLRQHKLSCPFKETCESEKPEVMIRAFEEIYEEQHKKFGDIMVELRVDDLLFKALAVSMCLKGKIPLNEPITPYVLVMLSIQLLRHNGNDANKIREGFEKVLALEIESLRREEAAKNLTTQGFEIFKADPRSPVN